MTQTKSYRQSHELKRASPVSANGGWGKKKALLLKTSNRTVSPWGRVEEARGELSVHHNLNQGIRALNGVHGQLHALQELFTVKVIRKLVCALHGSHDYFVS